MVGKIWKDMRPATAHTHMHTRERFETILLWDHPLILRMHVDLVLFKAEARLQAMGPMSLQEKLMLGCMSITLSLWVRYFCVPAVMYVSFSFVIFCLPFSYQDCWACCGRVTSVRCNAWSLLSAEHRGFVLEGLPWQWKCLGNPCE
jgi:hypothetical protein